jgi:hypothetical protein
MPKANSTSWRPGVSGNPKGRTPGTGKVATLREQINEALPGIVKAMVDRALDGDPGAARLLVERVIPALRPEERPVGVNMNADAPLADQGRALLTAVAAGELAPSQASTLLAGLSTMAKLIETDELAARVAALEERAHAKT